MHITLKKISNDTHSLHVARDDGTSEEITSETKSYLKHDFLHFAVESTARLTDGFWGSLASGKSLTELNDRTRDVISENPIEPIVGVLHNIDSWTDISGFLQQLKAQGQGLGWKIPLWFDEAFLLNVQEQMRQLLGQWKATPFNDAMTLEWTL